MSNPLSPLSPSYQNVRTRSPKIGSSPFLTKTLDEHSAPENIPSSPLKQTWTDDHAQSPNPSYYNENDDENENQDYYTNRDELVANDDGDDLDEPASSPFRPDARDETVDFQKLREMTNGPSATTPRHKFRPADIPEDPMSSPFRHDAQDDNAYEPEPEPESESETRNFQKSHSNIPPLSPGLDRRLEIEDPASSPFRPDARDETVDFSRLRDIQNLSPGIEKRLAVDDPASSPFRPNARDETVDFEKLREMQSFSPGAESEQPQSSPFRANVQDVVEDEHELEQDGFDGDEMNQESESRGFERAEYSPPVEGYDSPAKLDEQEDVPEEDVVEEQEHLHESPRESTAHIQESSPVKQQQSPVKVSPLKDQYSPVKEQASPVQHDVRGDINSDNHVSEEQLGTPRKSFGRVKNSSPAVTQRSPSVQKSPEEALEVQKLRSSRRSLHRTSLGRELPAATPRKRSFDETPQGQEEARARESHKKGMTSRPEVPDIHVDVDADEESSVIHNESALSMTSAMRDQSTIANSMMEDKRNEGMSTVLHEDDNAGADGNSGLENDYNDSMDETGLSTFSILPDMTSFAKLRAESPLKSMRSSIGHGQSQRADSYRQSTGASTPGTARRSYRASTLLDTGSPAGSPTPRRRPSRDFENSRATPNLLDFGESMNFFPRQSVQQGDRYSPARRSPMRPMRQSMRSPSKFSSLLDLDYEMAPAPTPRSLPSITPRELESLKSGFMSEISSLKATLSGKDAEVASLKTAISDAERRVGEALEEVRNEAGRREALEMEQAEWDRRGNEMESVLLSVRSELVEGERERERLARKAEESDKNKEQLEGRVVELESQLSAARSAVSSQSNTTSSSRQVSQSAEATAREVQDAVEKVARELHTLYKGKHETKVAALKKSYESRWEKRLREAEKKINSIKEENDRLRTERDAAQSDNAANANASMMIRENDEHEAEKRVFEAQIKGLQHEMASLKEDSERLRSDLKTERAEKGELVAAVDEWLAIQQTQPEPEPERESEQTREASVSSVGGRGEEYLSSEQNPNPSMNPDHPNQRRSVSRSGSSGIRAPVTGEKRRFGAPHHARGNSGGAGGGKSGIAVFTPGRGGIMSSIERMGRGGA